MGKNDKNLSKMYCVICGNEGIPINRRRGQYRGPGHLKKLYCIHCKQETNHVEIRSFFNDYNIEDFNLEKQYENFDKDGNRITPYRIFRGELKKKGII